MPWLLQAETEYCTAPWLADQDTTAVLLIQSGDTKTLVGTHGTTEREDGYGVIHYTEVICSTKLNKAIV